MSDRRYPSVCGDAPEGPPITMDRRPIGYGASPSGHGRDYGPIHADVTRAVPSVVNDVAKARLGGAAIFDKAPRLPEGFARAPTADAAAPEVKPQPTSLDPRAAPWHGLAPIIKR